METIINQITASQGLSAVAVLGLFNLLFLIIYAFFIGKAFDRIKNLQANNYVDRISIDTLFELLETKQQQLELLKKSHSELNQAIPKISKNLHEDFKKVLYERDKRVAEIEQEFSKLIERGSNTRVKINSKFAELDQKIDTLQQTSSQRFEELEGVYQVVEGIVKAQKLVSANSIPIIQTDLKEIQSGMFGKFKKVAEVLQKKIPATTKQAKFKFGDKVKTNKGTFYGTIEGKRFEKNKYFYIVLNSKKGSRWFSESTLRFQ